MQTVLKRCGVCSGLSEAQQCLEEAHQKPSIAGLVWEQICLDTLFAKRLAYSKLEGEAKSAE